ncbi:MAG: hypothetical protein A2144_14485 [Chloroflexi bacterium RBG_16_50_9]|nr:MAG: hypothetical protein A2144_14485 [Chloroflexi bacterium RBG_16_50_9]
MSILIWLSYLQEVKLYNIHVGTKHRPEKKSNTQQPVLQATLPAEGLRVLARMILRRYERERVQMVSGSNNGASGKGIIDTKTGDEQEECDG